jgi:hypothetical protein
MDRLARFDFGLLNAADGNRLVELLRDLCNTVEGVEQRLMILETPQPVVIAGSVVNPAVCDSTMGTQDTDAWDRAEDKIAVTVTVVSDIWWSSPYLYGRTRTLKFDSSGRLFEVTAESSSFTILTAEEC